MSDSLGPRGLPVNAAEGAFAQIFVSENAFATCAPDGHPMSPAKLGAQEGGTQFETRKCVSGEARHKFSCLKLGAAFLGT